MIYSVIRTLKLSSYLQQNFLTIRKNKFKKITIIEIEDISSNIINKKIRNISILSRYVFIFVLSFIKNLPSFDLNYQNKKKMIISIKQTLNFYQFKSI